MRRLISLDVALQNSKLHAKKLNELMSGPTSTHGRPIFKKKKLKAGTRQVQKSDRINSDHQSGSDQLGSTRIDSDQTKN